MDDPYLWLEDIHGEKPLAWVKQENAKALQVLDEDPDMYQRAERWIEAADWIIWQLCGRETRNACTAGYKGIYQDGRYPSRDYLAALHPRFGSFAADKLAHPISPLGGLAGVTVPAPEGAFYVFPRIDGLADSFAFCKHLLEETRVGLAPGVAFGPGGEGSVRICYAAERAVLEPALERLCGFLRAGG